MSITISDDELIRISVPSYVTVKKRETQEQFLHNEFRSNLTIANRNMAILRDRAVSLLKSNTYNDDFIKITHKIWLTNTSNPCEPNDITLNLVKNQCENLPTFKHILWTNHTEFCKQYITKLGLNIEVRNINEFESYKGWDVFLALLNQHLFATASDIARIMIICKYGGFYSDMGFALKPTIARFVNQFEIAANGELFEPGIVSHNFFFSMRTNHHLFETILNNLSNKELRKKYYWKLHSIWGIIELFSPRMLTAAVASLCKDDKVLLVVNNSYTFDRYHNNSWYGDRKYGCSNLDNIDKKKLEMDLSL